MYSLGLWYHTVSTSLINTLHKKLSSISSISSSRNFFKLKLHILLKTHNQSRVIRFKCLVVALNVCGLLAIGFPYIACISEGFQNACGYEKYITFQILVVILKKITFAVCGDRTHDHVVKSHALYH